MARRLHGDRTGDQPVPGYRLIRFLGKGQFGEVWLASAPGNKRVALKLIDLRGREGLKEFEALDRIKDISHPNLVPISASWLITTDGRILDDLSSASAVTTKKDMLTGTLAVDYDEARSRPIELIVAMGLGSKNLSDRLAECRKAGRAGIPVDELLHYMEGAAEGIDYLNAPVHDLGSGPVSVIHGDIKPQNLLIVGNAVQICDFGLARAVEALRKTATAMGTYAYAAPELLMGKPHPRSDQYCLAVSYIELRTGELPLFGEENLLAVAQLHREGKLDLSKLDPGEREIIRKATFPDPSQRWVSCYEMVRALRRARETGSAEPANLPQDYRPIEAEGDRPPSAALSESHPAYLGKTPSVGSMTETVPVRVGGTVGTAKRPLVSRLLAVLAIVFLLVAGGGAFGYWLWMHTQSRESEGSAAWFAKTFGGLKSRFENSGQDGKIQVLKEVGESGLVDRWERCVRDLAAGGDFDEAAKVLQTAPELLVGKDKIQGQWDELRSSWSEEIEHLALAAKFREGFDLLQKGTTVSATADQIKAGLTLLCFGLETQIAQSTSAKALAETAALIGENRLLEDTQRNQLLAKASNRFSAVLVELAGDYHFAEAFQAIKDAPATLLPEGRRPASIKKLKEGLAARVASLAGKERFAEAVSLVEGMNSAFVDDTFRTSLLAEIRSPWVARFRELIASGSTATARELLGKALPQVVDEALRKSLSVELWSAEFNERVKNARFVQAMEMLDRAPAEIDKAKATQSREEVRIAWLKKLVSDWETGPKSLKLLDDLSTLLTYFPQCIEATLLQARVHAHLEQFALVADALHKEQLPPQLRPLAQALRLLADGHTGQLDSRDELERRRKEVLDGDASMPAGAWRLDPWEIDSLKKISPPPSKTLAELMDKIKNLLISRKFAGARTALPAARAELAKEINPEQKDPCEKQIGLWEDLLKLHEGIEADIARRAVDEANKKLPMAHELTGRFLDIDRPLAASWRNQLDDWEKRIKELEGTPAPKPPPAAEPILQAQKLLGEGKFSEARRILAGARGALAQVPDPASRRSFDNRIEIWEQILVLADPQSSPAQVDAAIEATRKLLPEDPSKPWPRITAEPLRLAEALAQFALRADRPATASRIELAIGVVRSARTRLPAMSARLAASLARLWAKRIEIYAGTGEPPPPTPGEFAGFQSDWGELGDADKTGIPTVYVDAWRCEYLLMCSAKDPSGRDQAMLIASGLPANDVLPYVHYVRAAAFRAAHAQPQAILDELPFVFPESKAAEDLPPELAKVPNRLKWAAGFAISATNENRRKSSGKGLLGSPLSDPAKAEKSYKLLMAVRKISRGLLEPERQRDLEIGLALAALGKATPDVDTARALTAELVKLKDDALGPDATAILHAYIKSRLTKGGALQLAAPERPAAVAACTRLIKLLDTRLQPPGSVVLGREDAAALEATVLRPVLGLPQDAAVQELAEFTWNMAQFVAKHKDVAWPEKDLNGLLIKLYTSAIDASARLDSNSRDAARLAMCYVKRGQLKTEQPKPDLKQIIDDANQAIALAPGLHAAHGLLADACLRRAQSQPTREQLVADLKMSIAEAQKAVAGYSDADKPALASFLVILSSACVQRANYDNDPGYQKKTDLATAIQSAHQAEQLNAGQADFPYLALGNAYEDLAWLEEEEPEKNFDLAIKAFTKAAESDYFPAKAYCSIGRASYRALADTYLDPAVLGKRSKDDGLEECKKILNNAIERDRRCSEAYFYLAMVYQCHAQDLMSRGSQAEALAEFQLADNSYEQAKKIAEEQALAHRAIYVTSWAQFALVDANLAPEKRCEKAVERAAELKGLPMPLGGCLDPLKEMARIAGDCQVSKSEFEQAIATYSAQLPQKLEDARWSDCSLLMARARCQWAVAVRTSADPQAKEKFVAAAEAAAGDADRVAGIGIFRNVRAEAMDCAIKARGSLYFATKQKPYLSTALESVREVMKLAPRRPKEADWHEVGARLDVEELDLWQPASQPPAKIVANLQVFSEAIAWQKKAEQLSATPALRAKRATALKAIVQQGVQYVRDVQAQPNLDPQLQADLAQKLKEWQAGQPTP